MSQIFTSIKKWLKLKKNVKKLFDTIEQQFEIEIYESEFEY